MKKSPFYYCLPLILVLFSSCEVVAGIFKAGVWTGVLGIILVVGLIIWLLSRAGKK